MHDQKPITPLHRFRRPLPYTLLWVLPLVLVVIACVQTMLYLNNHNRLAPAAITGSLSMDEKIQFIGDHHLTGAQLITVGSSMGLNSIDSQLLVDALEPDGRYVNLSAWGRTIAQSYDWLKLQLQTQSPRMVIMPCSVTDFRRQSPAQRYDYKPREVLSRLASDHALWPHVKHFDPVYYLKHAKDMAENRSRQNVYESLAFDPWGGVLLDEIDWTHEQRWNVLAKDGIVTDALQYQMIRELADLLRASDCQLVVVQTPMRQTLAAQNADAVDAHFKQLAQTCDQANITFFNMHQQLQLDDSHFADGLHLNRKGAHLLTASLIKNLQQPDTQLTHHTSTTSATPHSDG